MLTIFTIPKPFRGHNNIIQRNAIQSWLRLYPKCEIILFGDDEGVAEAAEELGVLNIPEVEKNEFGTPLLNSAFNLAQKVATGDTLAYINADIILLSNFTTAVQHIKWPIFLIAGRRWDLDIKEEIQFINNDWENVLRKKIEEHGRLHSYSGLDYFIFPKAFSHNLPEFAVGRPGWDNWLIWQTRRNGIPVVDATEAITIIHQRHDYSHSKYGGKYNVGGPETNRNLKLAGGSFSMLSLIDADWILDKNGIKSPAFPRRFVPLLSFFYPWRLTVLIIKRIRILLLE